MRRTQACKIAAGAAAVETFEALLESEPDGLVIATPNFMHETQALAALDRGIAVFCQKPMALDSAGAKRILDAAAMCDRPIAVDFCYRYTAAVSAMKQLLSRHELGDIYAAELAFHNAYGPDRQWYYDLASAGGGCVLDLGIHLVDLVLWLLDDFVVTDLTAQLHRPARDRFGLEDYATIQFKSGAGVVVTIRCSWRLPTDGDAHIFAGVYGSEGGVELKNVNNSFYDFMATHTSKQHTVVLASPPDDWGGRALLHWIDKLSEGAGFDHEADRIVSVAEVIDRIYRQ